ncbi:MAG: hypothetical protein GXY42_04895 [Desulfovibrionales bacterium]|nr:hypothetical protein [Desulfovibrionales bacterium]
MNITCPNCGFGRDVDEASLPPKAAMATCPKCKHRFKFREIAIPDPEQTQSQPQSENPEPATPTAPPSAPPQPAEPPKDEDLWKGLEALDQESEEDTSESEDPVEPKLPAWELASSGYPQAFARTFLDVLSNPKRFFSAMPVGHGFIKPLLFFLIIIESVALSQSLWQLLGILPPSMITENLGHNLQAGLALILYPLQVSIFLFFDTAINHFFLRLFKADTKGFEGTFRAEVYSSAPMLLMVVPYIGLPQAMIGVTVYKFLGLRHVHNATNKQVLAVLILPMLLAFVVAIVLTLLFGRV